ncbi:hypothetical protein B7Z28_00030 [Candidatus Saccharibacteria bacterium 32-45-3]|nr:MAG: hypothetical protein B7Z28_00030 [Candidatus Saccharibacteria bacterium 32-45-3]
MTQQPLLIGGLLVFALAVVGLVFLIIRRSRKSSSNLHSDGERYWENYRVGRGESLAEIADRQNVEWEKVAIVNHLQPPYELIPGQTILIPTRYVKHGK